jgi:ubiquinone/menaquinone biosynthesis C-methylase UbiE
MKKPKISEYDNIDIIGRTHESFYDKTDQLMNAYYHKSEVSAVSKLLKLFYPYDWTQVVDVGTSIGTWLDDYRNFGFKKIIGIDISEKRAKQAKKRGYDEVHICNAYDTPFEDESQECLISNDVLVHVLQDSDKLKIFKEIHRILKSDGIFIFNIANALSHGYSNDVTKNYCRFITPNTTKKLIEESDLKIKKILPSYFVIPRIGANPKFVNFSCNVLFPITDRILSNMNNIEKSKAVYFCVTKK